MNDKHLTGWAWGSNASNDDLVVLLNRVVESQRRYAKSIGYYFIMLFILTLVNVATWILR